MANNNNNQNQFVITWIPGLFVVTDFLNEEEADLLLEEIEKQPWKMNRSNTRRVQMYGPWHDKNYQITQNATITPLPQYSKPVAQRILEICPTLFPQFKWEEYKVGEDKHTELFVNEYNPADSLQFHFDHRSTYKEIIMGVSLISDCIMSYQLKGKEQKVVVPARSLYLMTGDSRFVWKHGIHANALLNGDRRVSLTFRIVNYSSK